MGMDRPIEVPGPGQATCRKFRQVPGDMVSGAIFDPILMPIPLQSSRRDESNGLGPTGGLRLVLRSSVSWPPPGPTRNSLFSSRVRCPARVDLVRTVIYRHCFTGNARIRRFCEVTDHGRFEFKFGTATTPRDGIEGNRTGCIFAYLPCTNMLQQEDPSRNTPVRGSLHQEVQRDCASVLEDGEDVRCRLRSIPGSCPRVQRQK